MGRPRAPIALSLQRASPEENSPVRRGCRQSLPTNAARQEDATAIKASEESILVTCPNCGQSVREGQRFCSACGTDVPAALHSAQTAYAPQEEQPSAYAYNQPASYGYDAMPAEERAGGGRIVIIAGAVILAMCCALAFGFFIGLEASCVLPGNNCGGSAPSAPATRAPEILVLLPLAYYIIALVRRAASRRAV